MKASDFKQSERILRLIRQLTAEELSSLEIISDNPDGPPDCAITRCEYLGANHPGTDDEGNLIETFHGETLLECLLKAMSAKGLDEELDWSRDLDRLIDEANIDASILASIATAAAKALAMFLRCRDASRGKFSGSATAGFVFGADEFELTIKPKRTGSAFIETADSIENDRAGEPQFGEPLSIEDELAAVLGMGSPVQDLRGEYAAAYHRAHLEAIQEVGRCEGCGITAEELKEQGGELNTHHAISVERIFNEGLDPSLVGDRKNLVVVCRNGGDECHFLIGHDDDGPGGRGPSWARSNKHVRRDLAAHLEHKKHARQSAEYFMDPDGDGDDIP